MASWALGSRFLCVGFCDSERVIDSKPSIKKRPKSQNDRRSINQARLSSESLIYMSSGSDNQTTFHSKHRQSLTIKRLTTGGASLCRTSKVSSDSMANSAKQQLIEF